MISAASDKIRSLVLSDFDGENGPYFGPDYSYDLHFDDDARYTYDSRWSSLEEIEQVEKVLIEHNLLVFILDKCTSLKELRLIESRCKHSLMDQACNRSLEKLMFDNKIGLPDPVMLTKLSSMLPSHKDLEIVCHRYLYCLAKVVCRFHPNQTHVGNTNTTYPINIPFTSFNMISIDTVTEDWGTTYECILLRINRRADNGANEERCFLSVSPNSFRECSIEEFDNALGAFDANKRYFFDINCFDINQFQVINGKGNVCKVVL